VQMCIAVIRSVLSGECEPKERAEFKSRFLHDSYYFALILLTREAREMPRRCHKGGGFELGL
jgi:hypothetical protein